MPPAAPRRPQEPIIVSPRIHYLASRIGVPLIGLAVLAFAYSRWQWQGLALAASMLVMWGLLHLFRVMQVLQRATQRPVGWVDSAVMLNAKLRPGVSLLHVVALTRALGAQQSPQDAQPEVFRWTDGTRSHVTCEFIGGRLRAWRLERPGADSASE